MIEEGANAVICQHSHCPGCYEKYKHGYIVYGQGNLIFDDSTLRRSWHKGYLVKLTVKLDNKTEMNLIPYIQPDIRIGVRRMEKKEEEIFLSNLQNQSKLIQDVNFVDKQWRQFCQKMKYTYISNLRGHNRLFRYLNRIFHFSNLFYSKKSRKTLQNIIRCEIHREVLETILSDN